MAAVFRAAVGTRARPVFRSRTSCVCPYRSPQKLSFISARKCWKCSVIGIIFAIGCRSPFGKALACEAKANLHPLAFYTIEFTSPSPISPISPVQICHDLLISDGYRLSRRKQIIVGALRQYLGRGRPRYCRRAPTMICFRRDSRYPSEIRRSWQIWTGEMGEMGDGDVNSIV